MIYKYFFWLIRYNFVYLVKGMMMLSNAKAKLYMMPAWTTPRQHNAHLRSTSHSQPPQTWFATVHKKYGEDLGANKADRRAPIMQNIYFFLKRLRRIFF